MLIAFAYYVSAVSFLAPSQTCTFGDNSRIHRRLLSQIVENFSDKTEHLVISSLLHVSVSCLIWRLKGTNHIQIWNSSGPIEDPPDPLSEAGNISNSHLIFKPSVGLWTSQYAGRKTIWDNLLIFLSFSWKHLSVSISVYSVCAFGLPV